MKKFSFYLLILVILPLSAFSQGQGRRFDDVLEQYKAERIAYLSEKLSLTVSEAEKFWPVYSEYQDKRETMMRESRPKLRRPDPDSLSVAQMEEFMDAKIRNDLSMAKLAEEYHQKFKRLLGVKKVFILYHAEQEFMSYMIRKMRTHEGNEERPGRNGQGRNFTPAGQ